jgi:GTPase involved in cell partitioning and DNA repair
VIRRNIGGDVEEGEGGEGRHHQGRGHDIHIYVPCGSLEEEDSLHQNAARLGEERGAVAKWIRNNEGSSFWLLGRRGKGGCEVGSQG